MRLSRLTLLAASLALMALTACTTRPEPAYYAGQAPALDIERYFSGTLDVHGMFQDRSGAVQKRFTVLMRGSWKDGVGTLDEEFTYSDGTLQKRVWTLRKLGPGRYSGTAADVVGTASVVVAGNAMRLQYVLALPVDGKVYNIDFDDWMYLIDDQVMLNRAGMSKFGFGVGSLTVAFRKRSASAAPGP